jgi:hypothetical protein
MTHPGTDVLAEFRAGLITGHRGDRIAAHLAGCERCTAVDAQLAGLPTLMAAVPPPAMPANVAQRLDQVLAAEVAHRDQAERAERSAPTGSAMPPRRRRRGFHLPSLRVLTPVAAVAAVLAAGVFGLSQLHGSPEGPDTPSAAAGSAARSVAASTAPKAQDRAPGQGTAAQGTTTGSAPAARPQEEPLSFVYLTSRTDFVPATLTSQLTGELGKSPAAAGTVQITPDAVRGCVARLARGASVIRVETARYQGQAATVIFSRNGQRDQALITSPDCSGTNGHVVATRNLPAGISGP